MEILAQTEYQDLYRISDGVLLVINKFTTIEYPSQNPFIYIYLHDVKHKTYHKGCQNSLKELTEDYYNWCKNIIIPKGTIIYNNYPVKSTNDKSKWTYEVKTTGSCLGGSFNTVEDMLNTILKIMRA